MSKDQRKSFLWGVHYFRGVAILIIIAVHIWVNPRTSRSDVLTDWVGITREALFDGSTIYFILISGFLFQYLSHKFQLKRYYRNKLQYIILPYVFLTTVFLALQAFVGGERETVGWFLNQWPDRVIHGTMSIQFWYIPFISIIFLFSPLLLQIPEKIRDSVFPFLLILPLLGTRTGTELTVGQYIYFAPIYLFGMYACLKFDRIMELVAKYRHVILSLILLMTAYMFYYNYMGYDIESSKPYLGFVYARNMFIAVYILYYLEMGRDRYKKWLDQIAVYSFALFFTHYYLFSKVGMKLLHMANRAIESDWLMALVATLAVPVFVIVNLWLCMLAKRVLGKASRYLIGV